MIRVSCATVRHTTAETQKPPIFLEMQRGIAYKQYGPSWEKFSLELGEAVLLRDGLSAAILAHTVLVSSVIPTPAPSEDAGG